ncbi:MAG TPA: FAD:protein FMN transferase [Longimicrobiales bacterium]
MSLATSALFALLSAACPQLVERQVLLMGTTLTAAVCAQTSAAALAASEAVFGEVRRLEGVLSSWTADSEIGRLNQPAGAGRVAISGELYGLLNEAGGWVKETAGAFDPAVGALVDAWQLRGAGRVPSPAELEAALALTGWRHFELADSPFVVRGPRGWWLDTGGFGKGAALRGAALLLKQAGVHSAELDFGGQLLVLGKEQIVAVADPRERMRGVVRLRARDVSVSTSSQSERAHHIIDPRSGLPVPAWGSVTVVAGDALTADVLSTALFVMGPRAALAWARHRDDVAVLVLENTTNQPRASWNEAMSRLIIRESE